MELTRGAALCAMIAVVAACTHTAEHAAPFLAPAHPREAAVCRADPAIAGIRVGSGWVCAILSDGEARCWGANDAGQLGDGSAHARSVPGTVAGLEGVAGLALGGEHACAWLRDGGVACWGSDRAGQLGTPSTTVCPLDREADLLSVPCIARPTRVAGLGGVAEVAAGTEHTCARLTEGTVRCWGGNSHGELGDGSTAGRTETAPVTTLAGVVEIAAGAHHTCARLTEGTVRCWGANAHGELGDGTRVERPRPVAVAGLDHVVQIAARAAQTCARHADGTVRCWGQDASAESAASLPHDTPTLVTGLAQARDIVVGDTSACARLADGTVACWQPGPESREPRTVAALRDVVGLSAGSVVCATRDDRTLWCWGANATGELGDGTRVAHATPVEVARVSSGWATRPTRASIRTLAVGTRHACAGLGDGTAWCWGGNATGALGDGTTVSRGVPTQVAGLAGVAELVAGFGATCARLDDGGVACWGSNEGGRLGDGTTTDRATPARVPTLTGVVELAAGTAHFCARTTSGEVFCWGNNDAGATGLAPQRVQSVPRRVPGIPAAVQLAGAGDFTCARTRDAHLWCWGGALGSGVPFAPPPGPRSVDLLPRVAAIAAGDFVLCATPVDGRLACYGPPTWLWSPRGAGRVRQLSVPENLALEDVAIGAAGGCARSPDGDIPCWGPSQSLSLLGSAAPGDPNEPPRPALGSVRQLAMERGGSAFVCALLDDGSLACWGSGTDGELGDGAWESRPRPARVLW